MSDNWYAEYTKKQKERQNEAVERIKNIVLQYPSIKGTLTYEFDGQGDSGEIYDGKFTPSAGSLGEILDVHEKEIAASVGNLLPGGWEINDGSSGKIVITFAKKPKIAVHYGERETILNESIIKY